MNVTVVQLLLDLQEVDGRIRELELELKDLPRRKALETARLTGVSADLSAAKANCEYASQRVKGYEADARELKEKIDSLKNAQAGLKSNKEYQQYSVQIDILGHDLDTAENNQMAAMDDIPSAQRKIEEAQSKFDLEKSAVDQFCAEIDERIAAVAAELEAAKAERIEKKNAINNPKFLLYYERLRMKRWPVVVSLTHDCVCDGCHLVQPPSVAQMVDKNVKLEENGMMPEIVACTMCGRLLYR
jgi:predicted  nucleic acid-binding Zn-ribbon protein